jgi:hypothetical protein
MIDNVECDCLANQLSAKLSHFRHILEISIRAAMCHSSVPFVIGNSPHKPPREAVYAARGIYPPPPYGFGFETTTRATRAALVRSYDHGQKAMSNGKDGILLFFSK